MFLIAREPQELASCEGADGETKAREANKSGYFAETFSQKEERHEYNHKDQEWPRPSSSADGHPRFCFR